MASLLDKYRKNKTALDDEKKDSYECLGTGVKWDVTRLNHILNKVFNKVNDYRVYLTSTNEYVLNIKTLYIDLNTSKTVKNPDLVREVHDVKVKINMLYNMKLLGFEKSSDLFGWRKYKEEMFKSKEFITIQEVFNNHVKDDVQYNVAGVFNKQTGKSIKFLFDDIGIEFKYEEVINKLLKGYVQPKNRTIKVGTNIILINNKVNKNIKREDLNKQYTVIAKANISKGNKNFFHIQNEAGDMKTILLNNKDIKKIYNDKDEIEQIKTKESLHSLQGAYLDSTSLASALANLTANANISFAGTTWINNNTF